MSEFDLSSLGGDGAAGSAGAGELQEFLMLEKQKAQFNAQVYFIFIRSRFCTIFQMSTDFRFTSSTTSVGTNVWISPVPS